MIHSRLIIILQVSLLLLTGSVKAGNEVVNSRISGAQIVPLASVNVQDNKYPNVEVAGASKVASANSKVILSIDNASSLFFSGSYTVKVGLSIHSKDKNGANQTLPTTVELIVGYSPTGEYKDKSVYIINGSHQVSASIQYIKDGSGATIPLGSIPQNLSLEVEQTSERYYKFDPTTVGGSSSYDATKIGYAASGAASNEVDIHWEAIPGAEEYELEWTYINDYKADGTAKTLGTDPVPYSFRDNSTRVRVSETHYPITLIFDGGYVLFRVRGIGRSLNDLSKELDGIWSSKLSNPSGTEDGEADDVNNYNPNQYVYISHGSSDTRHEINKNWQYSASYAEEGKKKEVISYFDGSLRNRQSVTKLNTDDKTIVGETIYDYQGRGAVQVLPTPTQQPTIKFYTDFNKSTVSGLPDYSRTDFDEDNGSHCVTPTNGMSPTSGSSNYYSPSNTDQTGFQSYVPNANNYPFTQIEYTPDNTNRIREQSGVGVDHQLGTGRQTKYFYGQPEQVQLDRMFGSEVGDYLHYKKNMVIDANGQISVSYLDQQGKVIATSLAGTPPSNLNALGGVTPVTTTVNYIKANDVLVPNSNRLEGNSLIFSKELLVATQGDYQFYYDVEAPKFQSDCLPDLCYDCIYDLEISIKNSCGEDMIPPVSRQVGSIDQEHPGAPFDFTCGDPLKFTLGSSITAPVTVNLPVGNYTIYKKLSVSEKAIEDYTENFLAHNTCLIPYETFLNNAMADIDTNLCSITCDQCVAALGAYSAHNDATKADPALSTYDPNYQYMTQDAYDEALKECKAPCAPANLCEAEYQTLLSDVSPSGQYAKFDIDPLTGGASSNDPLSIYNSSNQLPDRAGVISSGPTAFWKNPKRTLSSGVQYAYFEEDGTRSQIVATLLPDGTYSPAVDNTANIHFMTDGTPYFYPENFANLADFIDEFSNHADWAKSLVEYHPEYGYYEWCVKNNDHSFSESSAASPSAMYTSDEFDDLLRSVDSYTLAVTDGLLGSTTDPLDLLNQDPYFNGTSPTPARGINQFTALQNILNNYNSSGANLKVICARTTRCGTIFYGTLPSTCDDFGTGSDATILNQEWVLYRNMYLAEKQKLQQRAADAFVKITSINNYNGCIGVGNNAYNPWYTGPFNFSNFFNLNNQYAPCGWFTYNLYRDKIKRFQNAGDAMSGVDPFGDPGDALKTLQNNAEYNAYLQTGQCPITLDLGYLLDNLAKTNNLVTSSYNLNNNGLFTKKLYDGISGTTSSFTYYYLVSSLSGSTLQLRFHENGAGGATNSCPLDLSFATSGYIWSDVVSFSKIQFINESPSGTFNFKITAFIDTNPSDQIPGVPVTVYGSTCMHLGGCSFPDNCHTSSRAYDIQNVFNELLTNNEFNTTSGTTDLTAEPYRTFFVTPVALSSEGNINSAIWNGSTSSNTGTITYTTDHSVSKICTFNFSFVNTSTTYTMADILFFANITPDHSNSTHFTINAYVSADHYEKMDVYNPTGCFNFEECIPPPNLSCTGPEYKKNEDFINGLNTIAKGGNLTSSFTMDKVPVLASLFNVTYPFSTSWNPTSVSDNTSHIKTYYAEIKQFDPELVLCTINMEFADVTNTHGWTDIVGFNTMQVPQSDGGHLFTVIAKFSDGSTQLLNGRTTCVTLTPCEKCSEHDASTNLLVNGSFETGTISPSTTDEVLQTGGSSCDASGYFISPYNTTPCTNDWIEPGLGHNGSGNFMFIHDNDNVKLWEQTVSSLQTGTNYLFKMWYKYNPGVGNRTFDFNVKINDVVVAASSVSPQTNPVEQWFELSAIWNSASSTSADIKILTVNEDNNGSPFVGLDDISFEEIRTTACPPTHDTIIITKIPYVNPCVQNLLDIATNNAKDSYDDYIKKVTQDFRDQYFSTCLNTLEDLKMVYDDREHHVTLYYYDQAGNLVKTVPPEGVVLVTNPTDLAQVAQDRLNNTQTFFTKHTLQTHYEYNSLNQLIRQATPDNTLMDKWTIFAKNNSGTLPVTANIYGMAFSDGDKGFVVGDDGAGHGVIYITTNNGDSWAPVSSLGIGNLQDVQFIPSTTTGYAIAEGGYLVKTTNSGSTWSVVPSPVTSKLNDLYFTDDMNGIVIGDKGTIMSTTNGGTNWMIIANPNTIYPIANLNDIQFIDASNGYIAGDNATLLQTTDGGATWAVFTADNSINTAINLNAVHFQDVDDGYVAGVNTANSDGVILQYKLTITGGIPPSTKIWTLQKSTSLGKFNSVFFIGTTSTGYAAGSNGIMFQTTDDGTTWTQQTISGFTSEITEISFPDITSNPTVGYATAKNGDVIKQTTSTWVAANAGTTNALNGLYFADINTGYAAGDGGTVLTTSDGGAHWSSLTDVTLPLLKSAVMANGSTTVGYAVGVNGGIVKTLDGGSTWSTVANTNTSQLNAVYFNSATDGFAVGNGGTITAITTVGVTSSAVGSNNWNDVIFTSSTTGYAIGNGGSFVKYASGWGSPVTITSPSNNLNSIYIVGNIAYIAMSDGNVLKTDDITVATPTWTVKTTGLTSGTALHKIYFKDQLTGYAMGDGGNIIKTIDGGQNWVIENHDGQDGTIYASHFTPEGKALFAGTQATGTNLTALDDESDDHSSRFYYDRLGRLIVSQNTKQFKKSTPAYSYTVYDFLGRITEVGELATSTDVNSLSNKHGVIFSDASYAAWLSAGTKTEITSTVYDIAATTSISGFTQENLRKRVSATYIDNSPVTPGYDHATFYSYDIHGNVKTLIQETPALAGLNQQYKRIDYDYDLVSGKVNEVSYQAGQADQMYHKYEYDADNRITNVITSNDGVIWDNDASYFYYKHGPLARVEVGGQKVQAMDYAYTIQGWIKGVNSNTLDPTRDQGKDGITGNLYDAVQADIHSKIGRDAYGYSLSYYDAVASVNGKDYSKINTGSNYNGTNDFEADASASPGYMTDAPNLFNGNIKRMVTTITDIKPLSPTLGAAKPQLTAYKYDQLNRIAQMKAYHDISGNAFGSGSGYDGTYESHMTYDANGNILTMSANGENPATPAMDNMTYEYDWYDNSDHSKGKRSNKLYHVNDAVSAGNYTVDIDDQGTFTPAATNNLGIINTNNNYGYDEIGNLVRDNQEQIGSIEWTVYGKIKKINRASGTKPDLEFKYDAAGNRVMKVVILRDGSDERDYTYYVRDASGNVMATYTRKALPAGGCGSGAIISDEFKQKEHTIYGSSRLGLKTHAGDDDEILASRSFCSSGFDIDDEYIVTGSLGGSSFTLDPTFANRTRGEKQYEMSNHLGNVLTTVSDRKIAVQSGTSGTIDYYLADISSTSDYYSFGQLMPGRNFNSNAYSYGYNDKLKDDEIKGAGNSYDYGARIYDPRIGRWLSLDPSAKKYSNWSPYSFNFDNPIVYKDPSGKDPITAILEGVTAFGIEAGLDFMTSIVIKGDDAKTSFNNINWSGAAFEGGKAFAIAFFLPTGSATAAKIAELSQSKIGKLTASFVANLTSEVLKNYASGNYDDENGNFSFDKLEGDFENLAYSAGIATLVDAGLGGKAEELYKKFSKSNDKLAKQYAKLFKAEGKEATKKVVANQEKKVIAAQKKVVKDAGKATVEKAKEETIKKAADETQKEVRGVKEGKEGG